MTQCDHSKDNRDVNSGQFEWAILHIACEHTQTKYTNDNSKTERGWGVGGGVTIKQHSHLEMVLILILEQVVRHIQHI